MSGHVKRHHIHNFAQISVNFVMPLYAIIIKSRGACVKGGNRNGIGNWKRNWKRNWKLEMVVKLSVHYLCRGGGGGGGWVQKLGYLSL